MNSRFFEWAGDILLTVILLAGITIIALHWGVH
jgi:hypothetical protein